MSKKGKVFCSEHLAGIISETDEGDEFSYDEKRKKLSWPILLL